MICSVYSIQRTSWTPPDRAGLGSTYSNWSHRILNLSAFKSPKNREPHRSHHSMYIDVLLAFGEQPWVCGAKIAFLTSSICATTFWTDCSSSPHPGSMTVFSSVTSPSAPLIINNTIGRKCIISNRWCILRENNSRQRCHIESLSFDACQIRLCFKWNW
jgi:hypothetical protein